MINSLLSGVAILCVNEVQTMEIKQYEVPAEKLRWQCDPNLFDFECTKDLAPLREFIGQDRAVRAIEFGLSSYDAEYIALAQQLGAVVLTADGRTLADRVPSLTVRLSSFAVD